ncbi:MAG: tetratricopeptide repeat protein [Acidobacteriia bacterium]|nr:tetratricopeptide repeat protein [Terriglobia bacterium]
MIAPSFLLMLVLLPAALPAEADTTLLLQELKILKQHNGPAHQIVAACLARIGEIYLREGQIEKAVAVLKQALLIRQAGLGPRHAKTVEAQRQLENAEPRLPVQP